MKYILILLILFISIEISAQVRPRTIGDKNVPTLILGKTIVDSALILPRDTLENLTSSNRALAYKDALRVWNGTKWELIGGSGGDMDSLRYGGPITSIPVLGTNPNTRNIADWIDSTFYQSQAPTATLTGGINLEFRSPQTMDFTLNYTAGRQLATKPLFDIVVDEISQTFIQPSAGSTVSGTQSVSFPANTNITYTNLVTTTDGKTATATTSFIFQPKRYWGFISDTTGIGTTSFNDAEITALNNELSTSKSKSFNTGNPTGVQFYVYAYYSSFGDLTQWDMNGFPSLLAMNKATRSFTNALGFVGAWTIYWSKNGQSLSSTVVAN